jgi:hypothetical protein
MPTQPRCTATTKVGQPCRAYAARGTVHAGLCVAGAPKGNRNAVKHGFYARSEGATAGETETPDTNAILADLVGKQA